MPMTSKILVFALVFAAVLECYDQASYDSNDRRPFRILGQSGRRRKIDPQCRGGRYSLFPIPEDESCRTYLVCRRGKAKVLTCPDGRRFDSVNYCTHGEADCGRAPQSQPLINVACPEPYGNFSVAVDCTQYISCAENLASLRKCPGGLAFDHNMRECIWEGEARCSLTEASNNIMTILMKA